jgi:ataxia telangiectasia mutated family protein
MLDQVTGEVVHIDFGIAYEQGKGLGTPETVPFRLTRDLIDGFGITGVEGTFRHSCQEVLRVLRENSIQLQTILEVVIHDPLYKWSLSPLQARKRQDNSEQSHLGQITKISGENGDDTDSNLTR